MANQDGPVQRCLVLRSFLSPGDVVMLTAAVRDLHRGHPGRFLTDVRTSADALFDHNPYVTSLDESADGVEVVEMHYPLIHCSNHRPYHFIHAFPQFLEVQLGLPIPVTQFHGDIHLSAAEREGPSPLAELGHIGDFWIVVAGGKNDFTAKWWNPAAYQAVVDHFRGRIQFVQCGEEEHWHPRLSGVIDLVGRTTTRDFVRLMHHADGVLCPVTFAMHLAAAVPTRPGKPFHRACVVVAGGREPPNWEAYPHHQFISTNGALACCQNGGCWRSRCQLVGDGDEKDRTKVCEQPVQLTPELRIPRCLDMITPADVIRRIDLYYEGGSLKYRADDIGTNGSHAKAIVNMSREGTCNARPTTPKRISIDFRHGLGDCAYFAHLIPLYMKRGFEVDVGCTPDKAVLFRAAGAKVCERGETVHGWNYPPGGTHVGQGRFWQGSKLGHNISELPLPDIGDKATLWDEYCGSRIDIAPHIPADARATATRYLERLARPILLVHTKGNSAQERKSLPDAVTAELYKALLDRFDGTIVLLDWDNRVPRLASHRVRHLEDLGPCSTEVLLAMMMQSDLLVGVDSGPLHAARLASLPAVGVWMQGHYPATYTLPRHDQLNVVLADHTRQWNPFKRIPWNIVEHPGESFDPEMLAEICCRMLRPPRYLPASQIAADVQLQQFVGEFCRGTRGNALSAYSDRNRSFDLLLRETANRFESPTIVETGTIRAQEDWAGAGFFTYLAGTFLHRYGGRLHSVDIDPVNCRFAREWTQVFGESVTIHEGDSVGFLESFSDRIDVLFLDSLDTTEPGHAEHALREFSAAEKRLHERSLVVVDDTPWLGGAFIGKGAQLVPRLLQQGWRILYAGYQVVLSRN